ncbi:MAG: LPS assembly protein LptD [Deltaproteobacteria bacterium]|nr:LPS assembly protein LptD [Deltaproteobacteria bacterium]MCL5277804.1 LPS assembly protein LptD [Deltaproteobacteria bacterium]
MQCRVIFFTVCLASVLAGSNARAIDLSSLLTQNGVIRFSADRVVYNDKTGVYDAEGNVRISKGDAVVSAAHIVFNSRTYDIAARGNVHWNVGKEVIRADRIEMNLSSQTGVVYNGYISIESGSYTISGKIIRKLSNVHFIVEDGKLTTCKCDMTEPAWDISARHIDATLGAYASIRDAFFKVKDLPILYVPWATIPVKTNRESGLLVPSYTYSGINGFTISLPYFWAISQDKDATFYLDAMTKRGLGAGADFRYARTIKDSGEFGARYFKELFLPYKRDRYYLSANYYQDIVGGIFSKGLLNYYSDRQYLNDFYTLLEQSSVEYVESEFTLQKDFDDSDALASLIYLEDMWSPNNDNTLEQLPFGSISYFPVRIMPVVPLYAEFNTTIENFERSNPALPKGQRYGLVPGLYLPFTIGDYLYFNSEAQYRAYLYNAGTYGIYKPGTILTTHLSAQVSTKISRAFEVKAAALRAVKHVAVPFVRITADHTMKDDEPYAFDEVENDLHETRYITAGIRNDFIGKVKPYENVVSYPVIGRLDLSSGYDLVEAARPLTGPTDRRRPFLPLDVNLVLQPPNFLSTNIDMSVDPATLSLTQTTVIESTNDLRGDSVSLSYSYFRSVISSINASLTLAVTQHMSLYGSANYSFYNRTLIQGVYGIRFGTSANCWDIDASYIQRPLTPSLNTVSVYLTLTGLGTIGR